MIYKGHYATLTEPVKSKSLWQLQEHIENAAGNGGNPNADFKDYQTAWIYKITFTGRCAESHYYSMHTRQWECIKHSVTNLESWRYAKQPYKKIALFFINIYKKIVL